ncbi:sulfide dehydrogenase [Acidovorax sp. SRB_14]|uniref:SorU family sulfite dehydrogenase c-type cytochrome subunit n=1 Tax=Acidovorax sp. SRB_14 TaxID=1962699 RepID=UPI00156727FC|nr:sulfide dehydrogenase [Acidovorax sp. SRB_14]
MPLLFNTPARFLRALAAPALLLAAGLCGTATSAADEAAQMALGKKLFTTSTPACAVCHTLKDAGAEGAVGPVLDELRPDAARVTKALRDGLGSMPSFKASLTDAQIAALALYVAKASRQP